MAKRRSNRARRREIERSLKKGESSKSISQEELIYNLKYNLNKIQSNNLLKKLSNDNLNIIYGNPLPKNYNEIRKIGLTYANEDFSKELIWYEGIFEKYYNEINLFLKLEKDFEKHFLLGNYTKALEVINFIEKNICVSYWSIEKKLLITEHKFGFKKNKELLTKIVADDNDLVTNILARYLSIRVEKNLSHFKYEEIYRSYVSLYDKNEIFEYFNFKLNFFSSLDYKHKGFFLYLENNSSIIDRYLIFRNTVLLSVCSSKNEADILPQIKKCCRKLIEFINDTTLTNVLISEGELVEFNLSNENIKFIECIDFYTTGEYEKCYRETKKFLKENPTYFELYNIYIKALINIGDEFSLQNPFKEDSVASKTLIDINNLIQKNKDTSNSLINFHKTFNSIGNTQWAYKCFSFFNEENPSTIEYFNYSKFALINSNYHNPILTSSFNEINTSINYLKKLDKFLKNSPTINFWIKINENINNNILDFEESLDNVSPFRVKIYKGKLYQKLRKYEKAISIYQELLINNDNSLEGNLSYYKEELILGILICNLYLEKYLEAIKLVVKFNIINPNFNKKLKFNTLINHTINVEYELRDEIAYPIILHQYNESPENIWIAYDNFLCHYGINYPHELLDIQTQFDKNELIYFLKNIAKQEVYYSSYMYENQDDLDNERIEICLALAILDEDNAKEYRYEISEISRNLLIRQGIKQIDESKIYVDVKGVSDSLEKDLKESFSRSLNLLNLSLDQIKKLDDTTDNVIVPYYGKTNSSNKTEFSEENIKITSYSRFKQFLEMFYKIRDKFIASNEFGIDTYLSMRIRHGTLLGETRSVYENYQLITKKESISGEYSDNEYWINQLQIDGSVRESFNKIMSEFSDNIDKLSEELKNKWLQVKTEKKVSEGLFDYSYDEKDLLTLFTNKFGAIDDYKEFFNEIIIELWNRTEYCLAKIRDYISTDIKSKNINLLLDLSSKLEELINKNENIRLNELIRNITSCQTSIGTEFDKISLWFRRTNNKSINEFYLDLPIDASLATLRRIYPEYSALNPTIVNNSTTKFEGEFFTQFTFLIQNLFENIIKHSNLKASELVIKLEIKEIENIIYLRLENNINKSISLRDRNKRIKNTRELLTKEIGELSRGEGGTGYPKIKKILQIDFKRTDFEIDISNINEDRNFITNIKFSINGLQKNE